MAEHCERNPHINDKLYLDMTVEEIYGSLLKKALDAFPRQGLRFDIQNELITICKRLKGTKYEDDARKYVQDVISFFLNRIDRLYSKEGLDSDVQVVNWLATLDYLNDIE